MCSLRIWWMAVGMRQRRPSPMVGLWPCPGSRKPEVQVKPLKFMISKELERVGIHLPAFPSAPSALPKACAVTRWESLLYRTRQWYVECKCVDLQPSHGRLDAISRNQSQPQLRLISSASSCAAQLRSARDEFRGRKSGHLFDRHHRPLRCNPELHRRPEYVHTSHPDESVSYT